MSFVCFFLSPFNVATKKFRIPMWLAFLLDSTAFDGP